MPASYNSVIIIGNLTRDVDLRYTPKGQAVTDMSLAINRTWTDESGQKQTEVTFVDCTAFGRIAEVCAQFLKKGSPAFVSGHLKLDTWQDKTTNQPRSKLKVVVENLQLIGGLPATQASSPLARTKPAPDFSKSPRDYNPDQEPDDQIPC